MARSKQRNHESPSPASGQASVPGLDRVGSSETGGHRADIRPSRGAWIILGLAFLLRFPDLGAKSLWFDEMLDWQFATGGWGPIFKNAHSLPYFFQKTAFIFGQNEFLLRLPSAVFGLVGIHALYLVARELAGERCALIAAAMLAFSPLHIYYSQDSHYYAMMMGFSTLALLALVRMVRMRSSTAAGAMLLAAYLAYKVHPAAAFVPAACIGTGGLWLMADQTLIRRAAEFFARHRAAQSRRIVWIALGSVLAAMSWFVYKFDRTVIAIMLSGSGEEVNATPNFEITFAFFSRVLRDFLGGLFDYSGLNLAVALVVAGFAAAGAVRLAFHNRWAALYLLMLIIAPWVALSVKHYPHFFHDRYVSFMVPGLMLCAAAGIEGLAGFAGRKAGSGRACTACLTVFFAIWAMAVIPNLARYYPGEKQNFKGAVKWLRDHAEPGARVASYLHYNQTSVEFYTKYFDLKPFHLAKIRENPGAPAVSLAHLKNFCREGKPVHVISSYQRYEPEMLFDWVRAHFARSFDSPTLHPDEFNYEGKNVAVHTFKYAGRFVQAPHALDVPLDGGAVFGSEFLFDRAGRYRLLIGGENAGTSPAPVSVTINGKPAGGFIAQPGRFQATPVDADIGAGPAKLEVSGGSVKFARLRIETLFQNSFRMMADEPSALHPSGWITGESDEGRRALVMKRNGVAAYDFDLSDGWRRYLRIEARHDAPTPVLLEVALDGVGMGMLAWAKADGSWEFLGMPFEAAAGPHRLEVGFLNEGGIGADLASSEDRDAWIHAIDLFASPPAGAVDNRLPYQNLVTPQPEYLEKVLDWSQPAAHKLWSSSVEDRLTFVDDPDGKPMKVARLRAPVPSPEFKESPEKDPALESVLLQPLPLQVQEGRVLYVSTYYLMEDLENFSANMVVRWLDSDGQLIEQKAVNQEGITEANTLQNDFGWIRTVAVGLAPEGARYVIPAVWIHRNGRTPSNREGALYIRPYRFEGRNQLIPE